MAVSLPMTTPESIRDLAGQRLMLGFDGTEFNPDLAHIIQDLRAGGIILFSRNVESPDQVRQLCRSCQTAAAECNLPPLFIAVDQEGGTVERLKEGFTRFPGNRYITTAEEARRVARITAGELADVGINMNYAPVLDVVETTPDSIMRERAFPGDARRVAKLGTAMIETYQSEGIMAVAKHFPGIGRTVLDSHFHLPTLDIDPEVLAESDMIPFTAAIKAGVSGIMLSHIFYPRLDDKWQASLSVSIARRLLRDRIGYKGLIMTDDLDMKAIDHDMPTCIRQILDAQVDLALICHRGPNIDVAAAHLRRLIGSDENLENFARQAHDRILRTKRAFLDNAAG